MTTGAARLNPTNLLLSLDRATIRTRLAASLRDSGAQKGARGDLDLTQKLMDEGGLLLSSPQAHTFAQTTILPPVTEMASAAVLVPLIEYGDGYKVLLTQRTTGLNNHAGQVAFPGGRMDPEDRDAEACALREAWEETGLDPAKVEILGRLTPWATRTGFDITPVVGAIAPPLILKPDPGEVAAVFEVPLAFFLDPANHRRATGVFDGVNRVFYEMPYEDRYIWGATAAMLINLYYALTP